VYVKKLENPINSQHNSHALPNDPTQKNFRIQQI